jgi:prepilin-type N-terminal cleavage/methylation domain-containing protein
MSVRNTFNKNNKGFTLIELLVVIGILAILLAITLIAINPARQFGQANDTKRRSDITQILNAIGQYSASNGGNVPTQIPVAPAAPLELSSTTALAPLCALLTPTYLPALPMDPSLTNSQAGVDSSQCAGTWSTSYSIVRDANNRITVSATGYSGALQVTR